MSPVSRSGLVTAPTVPRRASKQSHLLFLLIAPWFQHYSPSEALQQISWSSWIIDNILTLNSSNSEFLLIGLKQQLAKINSCSFYTVHSVHNLDFIFVEYLTFFLTRYQLNPATHIYVKFAVHISVCKQPASKIATSVVHPKLTFFGCYCRTFRRWQGTCW